MKNSSTLIAVDAFINEYKIIIDKQEVLLIEDVAKLLDVSIAEIKQVIQKEPTRFPRDFIFVAKRIETKGLLTRTAGASIKVTIEGMRFVKQMENDAKKTINTNGAVDLEAINLKLDEVIEWLKRNDMGNEIIFNEIQELRENAEKLDLKNWKQLLKGKLMDIGMEKVIGLAGNEINHIFKMITGQDITKLLN